MDSRSLADFEKRSLSARVFSGFVGVPNPSCSDQAVVDQACLAAEVANIVGCWEGYIEGVLREFIAKVRVQSHRKNWTLIAQFESVVDKMVSKLNTPSWDNVRELLVTITGMDPFAGWIWTQKFSNQHDTKLFFDGVMNVRHAFAHGFPIPLDVPGLNGSSVLTVGYINDVVDCVRFLARTTDNLLAHELVYRHGCSTGWS